MSPTSNQHVCHVITTNDMDNEDLGRLDEDSMDDDSDSETLSIPELTLSGENPSGEDSSLERLYWSPIIDRHRYAAARALGENDLHHHLIRIFGRESGLNVQPYNNASSLRQRLVTYVANDYTFMSLSNYQSNDDSDTSEASSLFSDHSSDPYSDVDGVDGVPLVTPEQISSRQKSEVINRCRRYLNDQGLECPSDETLYNYFKLMPAAKQRIVMGGNHCSDSYCYNATILTALAVAHLLLLFFAVWVYGWENISRLFVQQ